jgi:hypothetical protein
MVQSGRTKMGELAGPDVAMCGRRSVSVRGFPHATGYEAVRPALRSGNEQACDEYR